MWVDEHEKGGEDTSLNINAKQKSRDMNKIAQYLNKIGENVSKKIAISQLHPPSYKSQENSHVYFCVEMPFPASRVIFAVLKSFLVLYMIIKFKVQVCDAIKNLGHI